MEVNTNIQNTTVNTDVTNTDNVSVQNTSTTDNSDSETDLQQQISNALSEPENVEEPTKTKEPVKTEQKDNNINCPDKFKNEDGSVNVENVLKSYKEIEPLVNEKAAWTKERAELLEYKKQLDEFNKLKEEQAKQAGYDSNEDMEHFFQIASLEANEYAKYLQYTENPEELRQKLINYANNPTQELMEEIEMEFSPEVNKRIAVLSERQRQQFEADKLKQVETQKMTNIENVINQSVNENKELFNYEPFKQLFINTLHKFGDNFTFEDAKALMDTVVQMKELFKTEFEKQSGIKLQNKEATDKLAAINNVNSAPAVSQPITNADLDKMSERELAKVIKQFI